MPDPGSRSREHKITGSRTRICNTGKSPSLSGKSAAHIFFGPMIDMSEISGGWQQYLWVDMTEISGGWQQCLWVDKTEISGGWQQCLWVDMTEISGGWQQCLWVDMTEISGGWQQCLLVCRVACADGEEKTGCSAGRTGTFTNNRN
jgi:hypothetical protein